MHEKIGIFEEIQNKVAEIQNVWHLQRARSSSPSKASYWFCNRLRILFNSHTSLFRCTTPEAAITGTSMHPRWVVASLTSGGQTVTLVKSCRSNVLIIFDELSNAVCPSSLALLVTKIAGKSFTVRPILSAEANFKLKSQCRKKIRF